MIAPFIIDVSDFHQIIDMDHSESKAIRLKKILVIHKNKKAPKEGAFFL